MSNNRPMSEQEGALFDAVVAISSTLLELGANREVFQGRLVTARDAAEALGNQRSAATLDFLIRSLFSAPDPAPKPAFRIV